MSQFLNRTNTSAGGQGTNMKKKRYLVLSDGTVYEGFAIETLTDPSYYGQIVLQTYPLIGNYGIIEDDFEGECFVKGYVVREWCEQPSNFRCQYTLDTFLKDRGVPGIYGVDTREITRTIREHGVMNAILCDSVPRDLSEVSSYVITDAVPAVTTKEKKVYEAVEGSAGKEGPLKVALLDYGAKRNIIRELQKRGCDVVVLPGTSRADDVLDENPDGIMLSNGPGDPADAQDQIMQIAKLLGMKPIFGICLGHQLTAIAAGAKTTKLKYGHRGVNQPCRDVKGTRTFITSQNHGYAVVSESVKRGEERYINANDKTCEGIDYPDWNAFTVQFHPEASSGPHDTSFLFDRFIDNMKAGEVVRGGSTLSMQVVRMSRDNPPRTYAEKMWEVVLAMRLELHYSKKSILDLYAANAPFGGNVVGIDAAAWRYFHTTPDNLSWGEAATLAVLPNSPALIHPGRSRDRLEHKRDELLRRMPDAKAYIRAVRHGPQQEGRI